MRFLTVVVFALSVACAQTPNTSNGNSNNNNNFDSVDTSADASQAMISGSRIKIGYTKGADGLKLANGRMFDSLLEVECISATVTGGSVRCVPSMDIQDSEKFADSTCTTLIGKPVNGFFIINSRMQSSPGLKIIKATTAFSGMTYTGRDCTPDISVSADSGFMTGEDITNNLVELSEEFE